LSGFLNKTIEKKDNLINATYFLRSTASSHFSNTRNRGYQMKLACGRFEIAKSLWFFINEGKNIKYIKWEFLT